MYLEGTLDTSTSCFCLAKRMIYIHHGMVVPKTPPRSDGGSISKVGWAQTHDQISFAYNRGRI